MADLEHQDDPDQLDLLDAITELEEGGDPR